MQITSLVAFLLYISIVIGIGLFSARKSKSASGYILGNRSLSYWVTAISANAADMSVWLFMGLPMAIYKEGLTHIWTAVGLIFFMFLNWHFIAPKLRRATEHHNSLTLPTFFEKRLGTRALSLRIIGASFSTVFLTIYVSAGITGMGYLFESIFGLDYALGCTLSILAVLLYISIGGFTAICYTDFFQGIFLLFVILLVPALIYFKGTHQGSVAVFSSLSQNFLPTDSKSLLSCLTLAFGWGIGYFGQPHILNKFMAIENPHELNKSKWLGTVWQVLALGGAVWVGCVAHSFFVNPPSNAEVIFVDMVQALFSPFFAAFVLCAILAATLSTIDSQILVIASVIAEDFFASLNPHASDKKVLMVSRLSAIATCLLALGIALLKVSSIYQLVYYCWVGMGSAFGPLVIASLYYRHLTKNAAVSGMLVGGIVGLLWILLDTPVSATIPGFLAGSLCIWLVSTLERRSSP